ncbi:MAG: peptidase M19 [Rhizobiaceae bacterium]|nr:peptidase M19 [Rhizobiaceae bacterium]
MNDKLPLIFDGHNDVLLRMSRSGETGSVEAFTKGRDGAIDLHKSRSGGFGGGFFAIYIPSSAGDIDRFDAMNEATYDLPLPDPIEFPEATQVAQNQASILIRLQEIGALEICTTSKQIADCFERGVLAAIMHMEGAEAIDEDFSALDLFHRAGLRSIGPVWSRPNSFGHGVPFRFPSNGNIGPGLTAKGIELVKRCNELNIMLDLSHLNEAGFWDVAKHSDAPLVATHSNVHQLCNGSRNLTDRQLAAIAESDGMVGVNFAVAFLRSDGQKNVDTSLDLILKHLDYLIDLVGENRVGFGSDYDGADVPVDIHTAAKLPNLRLAMRSHGYDETLMDKLCHKNWLRVLAKTWGV